MLIRWAYNPKLEKVGTVDELDDDAARTAINDGWAVKVDDAEAPPPPPEEHHAEADGA